MWKRIVRRVFSWGFLGTGFLHRRLGLHLYHTITSARVVPLLLMFAVSREQEHVQCVSITVTARRSVDGLSFRGQIVPSAMRLFDRCASRRTLEITHLTIFSAALLSST
ncbi:MAG: hypothetical protein LZF60_80033 [Nitrospira sp.]|nr:MAG: hypothetical protein LZF60_80033 [Nitrospira sp.]